MMHSFRPARIKTTATRISTGGGTLIHADRRSSGPCFGSADSQNRWIGKSVDPDGDGPEEAVETHFVYQGNQIILQVDGEGQVTNRYLWGPAVDQILADEQVQEDGTSEVLWTLTDHLNTVRDLAVYDPEADVTSVVSHIVYDTFGRVTGQTDPTVGTLFGFTARPFDSDTGLQNNLNRWYDAETGAWIGEDPMGFAAADANLYRYVGNDVTMIVDPTGLAPPPSGFFGSWGASWTSMQNTYTSLILEHYYGLPREAHDFMEQAYETGPLGQTKDSGPITKYGTRGALGVATAATAAASALIGAEALGVSSVGSTPLFGGGAAAESSAAALPSIARDTLLRYGNRENASAALQQLRDIKAAMEPGTLAYATITSRIEQLEYAIVRLWPK